MTKCLTETGKDCLLWLTVSEVLVNHGGEDTEEHSGSHHSQEAEKERVTGRAWDKIYQARTCVQKIYH